MEKKIDLFLEFLNTKLVNIDEVTKIEIDKDKYMVVMNDKNKYFLDHEPFTLNFFLENKLYDDDILIMNKEDNAFTYQLFVNGVTKFEKLQVQAKKQDII